MEKQIYENEEMNRFFYSLPPMVQEGIIQSGVKPCSASELKSLADGVLGKKS